MTASKKSSHTDNEFRCLDCGHKTTNPPSLPRSIAQTTCRDCSRRKTHVQVMKIRNAYPEQAAPVIKSIEEIEPVISNAERQIENMTGWQDALQKSKMRKALERLNERRTKLRDQRSALIRAMRKEIGELLDKHEANWGPVG